MIFAYYTQLVSGESFTTILAVVPVLMESQYHPEEVHVSSLFTLTSWNVNYFQSTKYVAIMSEVVTFMSALDEGKARTCAIVSTLHRELTQQYSILDLQVPLTQ